MPRWICSGSLICKSDREDRVERGHRLLEDHRNVAAADFAHLLVVEIEQMSGRRRRCGLLESWPVRRGNSRMIESAVTDLPEPGLADDGDHFAAAHGEADAFDGAHDSARSSELGVKIGDFQKRGNRLGLRVRSFTQCVASLGDTQPYPLALAARHHARCPRPPKATMGGRLKSRKCVITQRPASADALPH